MIDSLLWVHQSPDGSTGAAAAGRVEPAKAPPKASTSSLTPIKGDSLICACGMLPPKLRPNAPNGEVDEAQSIDSGISNWLRNWTSGPELNAAEALGQMAETEGFEPSIGLYNPITV